MYMIPKEIYARVISNLSGDQRRRVDEINVEQVNVACGPLFAGLKKGKNGSRTSEILKAKDQEPPELREFLDRKTPEVKELLKKRKNGSRTSEILKAIDQEPPELREFLDRKASEVKELRKLEQRNRGEKGNYAPKGKNVGLVKKEKLKATAKIGQKKKKKKKNNVKNESAGSSNEQKTVSSAFPIKVKKTTSEKVSRKGISALNTAFPHDYPDKTTKELVQLQPRSHETPIKPSTNFKSAKNDRESAETAIWNSILSPAEKKDKSEREKNIRNGLGGKRNFGLSGIGTIPEEGEEEKKKKKKGRKSDEQLESTVLGAADGANDATASIFDKETILVPKSAEKRVEEIVLPPESDSEESYGSLDKVFGPDMREKRVDSSVSSINEDIMNRLTAPGENIQEAREIGRGLEQLSTPKSVRKLAEKFASSPEKIVTPPRPLGDEYAFQRSSKMARSPISVPSASSFYGKSADPPLRRGDLGRTNENVTTRNNKEEMARKEREKKRRMNINVPTPTKGKKSGRA